MTVIEFAEHRLQDEIKENDHGADNGHLIAYWTAYLDGARAQTNKTDNPSIDHPAHYQGDYECIDLMREIYGDEAVRHFCICNAYKYRFRAGAKQTESAHDDIKKAEWYEKYIMEKVPNNYRAWADRRSQNAEQQIGAD